MYLLAEYTNAATQMILNISGPPQDEKLSTVNHSDLLKGYSLPYHGQELGAVRL